MTAVSTTRGHPAPRVLLAAAVLIGVVLRVWQYAAGTSLWLDELALTTNLVEHSAWQLATAPLDFHQVAPLGFVLLEKGLITLLGDTEFVLRLWSFLAGISSVVVAALLAKEVVGPRDAWIPTLLLAISVPLVWQSAQVKPYSGDILIAELIMLFALGAHRRAGAGLGWPALLGALAPWLSLPSVFVLGGAGLALLLGTRESPQSPQARSVRRLVILWAASGLGALAVTAALTSSLTSAFMKSYWAGGFPVVPPRSIHDVLWPLNTLAGLFIEFGGFRGARLLALLLVLGAGVLASRRLGAGVTLAFPLLAAFAAAALRMYPLAGRVAYWLAPSLFLLLTIGARFALDLTVGRIAARAPALLLAALLWFPVRAAVATPPPQRFQEAKPVIRRMVAASQPGDAVYVYYGAWQAYRYYGPRLGLDRLSVKMGACSRRDRRLPLREIWSLLDHDRIWILMSHAPGNLQEREMIMEFLDRIGARRLEEFNHPTPRVVGAGNVTGMLYDVRDARRVRASGAPAPLPVNDGSIRQPGCWGPLLPDSLDHTGSPEG